MLVFLHLSNFSWPVCSPPTTPSSVPQQNSSKIVHTTASMSLLPLQKRYKNSTRNNQIPVTQILPPLLYHSLSLPPFPELFYSKLQTWFPLPLKTSVYFLKARTLSYNNQDQKFLHWYNYLIYRPYSNFTSCPSNIFYSKWKFFPGPGSHIPF